MVRLLTPHLGTPIEVPDELADRYRAAGYLEDKPNAAPRRPAAKKAARPAAETVKDADDGTD